MKNTDIVYRALNTLENEIPIKWDWKSIAIYDNRGIDGYLTLVINGQRLNFDVAIKKEMNNHQLFNLIQQSRSMNNFLLIAEKLYPKVQRELKENNINYIEANGNIYLNQEAIYLYINTNRTLQRPKDTGNRAFTKTGLKVVFHFLLEPQLLNQTQRKIAETTHVALGNIPQVISGLLDTNLILKLNKKEYVINEYQTLLHKWITEYEQTLKPSLLRQRFKLLDRDQNWKEVQLNLEKTVWGGEPAGDIISNHLRPEQFTLYTEETTKDLIQNYKIIPHNEGDIWVYDRFWDEKFNTKTAPLQLVYADLLIADDKRCRETANIIFNEHIKPNL